MSGWSPMSLWLVVGKGDWREGVRKLASVQLPPKKEKTMLEDNDGQWSRAGFWFFIALLVASAGAVIWLVAVVLYGR